MKGEREGEGRRKDGEKKGRGDLERKGMKAPMLIAPATHKKRGWCTLLAFVPRERKKRGRREGEQEPKYLCIHHYHLQGEERVREERE